MSLRTKLSAINVIVWAGIVIAGVVWLLNDKPINSSGAATDPKIIIPFMLFVGSCLFGMVRVDEIITGRLRSRYPGLN